MGLSLKWLRDNWAIVTAIFAIIVGGAHADSRITQNTTRLDKIEGMDIGSRLARMEARQEAQSKQLDRMEQKLDTLH